MPHLVIAWADANVVRYNVAGIMMHFFNDILLLMHRIWFVHRYAGDANVVSTGTMTTLKCRRCRCTGMTV
jgi:hypothetical protein